MDARATRLVTLQDAEMLTWQRKREVLPGLNLSPDTWHGGLPQTSYATRSYTNGVMQVIHGMLAGPPPLHFQRTTHTDTD